MALGFRDEGAGCRAERYRQVLAGVRSRALSMHIYIYMYMCVCVCFYICIYIYISFKVLVTSFRRRSCTVV